MISRAREEEEKEEKARRMDKKINLAAKLPLIFFWLFRATQQVSLLDCVAKRRPNLKWSSTGGCCLAERSYANSKCRTLFIVSTSLLYFELHPIQLHTIVLTSMHSGRRKRLLRNFLELPTYEENPQQWLICIVSFNGNDWAVEQVVHFKGNFTLTVQFQASIGQVCRLWSHSLRSLTPTWRRKSTINWLSERDGFYNVFF